MTTIITRLYSDRSAANAAMDSLLSYGHDKDMIMIITAESSGGALAAMKAARVSSASASAYVSAMKGDQALLVVEAPFNPIGTARTAIKVLARHPALDVGLADEDMYLREYPNVRYASNTLKGNPLLMSNPFRGLPHGHIFGSDPIIHSKPRSSAMRGGGYMSRMFWPMKLVSTPTQRSSAIRGGMLFSSLFGLPLIISNWASREDLPTIIR